MTGDRRNPYVILGVPFGAGQSEARTGFAKASRRLRADTDARYSMEDLTWALHQVEQIIEESTKAFSVYRVPADPNATAIERFGVFNPQPEQIPRNTAPSTTEQREDLRARASQELIRDALTTELVRFAIPQPYEPKELANG